MNIQTIQERTQAIIAQREQKQAVTNLLLKQRLEQIKENLPKKPNVPIRTTGVNHWWCEGERTGKRNRTMLTHDCWFFKKPELNSLTVAECIERYPKNFIWAYENLQINWSEYIVHRMKEKYPWAVRKVKEPFNF